MATYNSLYGYIKTSNATITVKKAASTSSNIATVAVLETDTKYIVTKSLTTDYGILWYYIPSLDGWVMGDEVSYYETGLDTTVTNTVSKVSTISPSNSSVDNTSSSATGDALSVDRIVMTTSSNVGVLCGPSLAYQSKGWMDPYTQYTATAKKSGYYYIEELDGWVSADYLSIIEYNEDSLPVVVSYGTSSTLTSDEVEEIQRSIYEEYVNTGYSEEAASDLLVDDLNGIYGIPYQFPASVDMKLDGTSFGRIYAERIIERMPILMMSPGKIAFMKDYSSSDKKSVIEQLLSAGDSTLSEIISKPGKYYTFEYDSTSYWQYVNSMNRTCAVYLGIEDVKVSINGKTGTLGQFNWENASNGKFDSLLVSTEQYTCFYTDASSTKSEDFSNSTTESTIASKVNGYSDLAKEARFILGASTGNKVAFLEEENIGDMEAKIDEIADQYLNGSKIFSDLGKDFAVIAAGGKLIFPEIWSDSEFSQSFDVNLKLRCPCPNLVSWFLDIMVPLNMLIAYVMPRAPYGKNTLGKDFDAISNAYMSPFLVRAFYRGLFNCDMGIVTSLSIQKGSQGSWTLGGLPTEVDVSMTIKDLYNVMVMSSDSQPKTYVTNTCFLNYLANCCGISVNKPDIERSVDLYWQIIKKNVKNKLTHYYFWKNLEQSSKNKMYSFYTKYFGV